MTADTAAIAAPGELEPLSPEEFQRVATEIETAVGRIVVGQTEAVRGALICLIAGGDALLEGVPGLGKTTLTRALSSALELAPKRIQGKPAERRPSPAPCPAHSNWRRTGSSSRLTGAPPTSASPPSTSRGGRPKR